MKYCFLQVCVFWSPRSEVDLVGTDSSGYCCERGCAVVGAESSEQIVHFLRSAYAEALWAYSVPKFLEFRMLVWASVLPFRQAEGRKPFQSLRRPTWYGSRRSLNRLSCKRHEKTLIFKSSGLTEWITGPRTFSRVPEQEAQLALHCGAISVRHNFTTKHVWYRKRRIVIEAHKDNGLYMNCDFTFFY